MLVAGVQHGKVISKITDVYPCATCPMLSSPVHRVPHTNEHMLNGTSPSTISPHHQDAYYTHPTPSSPNTGQQDESPNRVVRSRNPNKKTRKFGCQCCGRKFLRAEHLRRHEITRILTQMGWAKFADTGEKPFHCRYCHQAFSRKSESSNSPG